MGRLELRMSDELLARLDEARGDVPRGTFVKAALEDALAEAAPWTAEADARAREAWESSRVEEQFYEPPGTTQRAIDQVTSPLPKPQGFVKPFRPMPKGGG